MYAAVLICLLKIATADLVVETSSGLIQGVTSVSGDVEEFLGIPYAEPPIGDLRFAKPVPKKSWTKIFNASKLPPPCAQISLDSYSYYYMPDITEMSEDCLYLNIWAPKSISGDKLKPVVIFIHPGGFIVGASCMNVFDGTNFARRGDNIVVTINYRLGLLGFFLAYIEEADGNMGMYDQVMAIKWVKENVIYFGGDPENIVLMGESAGAQSIAAHIISPMTRNLFQKAIIHSGSIIIPSYFENNTRLFNNSKILASNTGCSNESVNLSNEPHFVVNCLKHKTAESLLKAERRMMVGGLLIFIPRINDAFLPQKAIQLLREGKFKKDVPILTGINKDEGTMFITAGFPEYFGIYGHDKMQTIRKSLALMSFRRMFVIADIPYNSKVVDFYFNNVKNRTSQDYTNVIADAFGDYMIACGTVFQADFLSLNGNPVYFYKFQFRAASTPMAEWVGVTHMDELQYIFSNPYHKNFTKEEFELSNHLMDRWSAFLRTGNPNLPGYLPWHQYTYQNPCYLSIDQEEESIRLKPIERCKIWRKAFDSDIPTQV